MKKLMFAAAAMAACVASAEGLQSANTVGYVTREVVRNSYNMLAIQFQDVGSIVESGDIAKAITTDLPALDYGTDYDFPDFPQIMIKTSETSADYGKKFYYYTDTQYIETSPGVFEVLPPGWYDGSEEPPTSDDLIALGRGFWLVIPDGEDLYPNDKYTISFAGQVATSTKPISVPVVNNGYIMMANPFPVALDFNKMITPSAGVPALDYGTDYDFPDFPQIMVKTSDTSADYSTKFYYYTDSQYSETSPGVFEVLPAGWYDGSEEPPAAADFVKPGNSFWVVIPDGCLSDDKQTFTFSMN